MALSSQAFELRYSVLGSRAFRLEYSSTQAFGLGYSALSIRTFELGVLEHSTIRHSILGLLITQATQAQGVSLQHA